MPKIFETITYQTGQEVQRSAVGIVQTYLDVKTTIIKLCVFVINPVHVLFLNYITGISRHFIEKGHKAVGFLPVALTVL